ncbi:hypothetical protein K490DRAFT_70886 [Saccharata proteae CBS 121410]|uniref:Uncharacterized protein n=1 Tax=Saccharata proteae CBS 121410 TaxID=1314787 RepID=A0A9P4I307_9PEZI|nr:hypothetical protein K490DRAFT_70886 [Saccharata proteae CBS 121410]
MASSPDAPPPKRPGGLRRHHSSTSSQASQAAPDEYAHHRAQPHKHQRHVVGHGRMGPRNPSFGKNLNKLGAKAPPPQANDGNVTAKHHRRSMSGNSTPVVPSSPRPALKRNQSTVVQRTTSHVALRKNRSSGHLPRQVSSKNIMKALENEAEASKKGKMRRRSSPEAEHPTVRFDIGDEDEEGDEDNAWTEESASQSPATTRSNTRQNSVILDTPKASTKASDTDASSSTEVDEVKPKVKAPAVTHNGKQQERMTYSSNQINGASSYHHQAQPNVPDADMITSRILQRSASNRVPPQVSDISATIRSDSNDARSLSHSASTMIDTPGNKEVVSRFIDGNGSSGTPRDSSFLPHHPTGAKKAQPPTNNMDASKRNKSAPNIQERDVNAPATAPAQTRAHTRSSSGTNIPADLHPSRTQQKLWLQRASSNIEPQKPDPYQGPVPIFGFTPTGDVMNEKELQRRFDEVVSDYKVVRRFRNPVADAVVRLARIPNNPRKKYIQEAGGQSHQGEGPGQRSALRNGVGNGTQSMREPSNRALLATADGDRKGRGVSFDLPMRARDDVEVADGRARRRESEERDEAMEICRRIWERSEMVEGD